MDFKKILKDISIGKPIIVVDDYLRENEGDLVIAAEKATEENLAFIIMNAHGLMCVPCLGKTLERLEVPMMVQKTNDPLETPFSVSVDAITTGTGMSVQDRLKTLHILLDESSKPSDIKKPGHLFPLRAREKLLLERRGHTEASIELMRLAGLKEVAVITEVMKLNGEMARLNDLRIFAKEHDFQIISVEEIYTKVYG